LIGIKGVRKRRPALHSIHFGIEGTRAHGVSQSLNRIVRFTPHDLHEAGEKPGRREVWIEEQRLIDQGDAAIEVSDEICQRMSASSEGDSVILAELYCAMGQSRAFGHHVEGISDPAVEFAPE
jgi:hypothetical protein